MFLVMSNLKCMIEKKNIKLYQKKKTEELIKRYLNENNFDNAVLFILKQYYPNFLRKNDWEKTINYLRYNYFEKYFKFNKNNYSQIIFDIGIILKIQNGLDQIKRLYNLKKRKRKNNEKLQTDLLDFFNIKKHNQSSIEFKYFNS